MRRLRREGVYINSQEIHLYAVSIANNYMQFTGKSESWKQQLSVDDYNTFRCQALKEITGGVELSGKVNDADSSSQPTPALMKTNSSTSASTSVYAEATPKTNIIKMPEPVNMTEEEAEAAAIEILNALPD